MAIPTSNFSAELLDIQVNNLSLYEVAPQLASKLEHH